MVKHHYVLSSNQDHDKIHARLKLWIKLKTNNTTTVGNNSKIQLQTGGNRDKIDTPSIHSGPGTGTSIIDRDKLVLWELNTLLVNGCGHASVFYMGVVMPTLTYNWVSSVVVMNTEP